MTRSGLSAMVLTSKDKLPLEILPLSIVAPSACVSSATEAKTLVVKNLVVDAESCRGTGYRGRMGIYELLVTNDEIRELANLRTESTEIKRAAIRSGMSTLRVDGWMKAIDGVTTIDEVLRVTKAD